MLRGPITRCWLVLAAALGMGASDLQSQPPRPVRRDFVARAVADTTKKPVAAADTTKKPITAADTLRLRADSIRKTQLEGLEGINKPREISFSEPDSAMAALLGREGYSVTKYQGNNVIFKATEHTMFLVGTRAQVARDSSIIVGDTITFNDSTQIMGARGDTIVLRDPAQGPDDVVSIGYMRYDIPSRRGVVREVTTAVESGQRWIVHGNVAAFKGDSTEAGAPAFYAQNGWLTSCEEKEPHYHFAAREMKMISKNVMVVRPAVLYIADVPVLWLPFVFNDMRPGRRSGLLAPQIGFNQIFRQSPFAQRFVDNVGYYFAISDYVSTQFTLDWRSNARATEINPGYVKLNTIFDYRWKDRFIDGKIGVSQNYLRNGQTNRQYSVSHQQKFSERTSLNGTFNYSSNTTVQRQTTFNPIAAIQTIKSQMNFRSGRGPFSLDMGGSQTQYPGRKQLDREFPTVRVSAKPIEVGAWLTWTPSFSMTNTASYDLDQVGDFAFRYIQRAGGGVDSVRLKRDTRNSNITFDTPLDLFGWNWRNSFRISDVANEFPERRTIYPNPRDTSVRQDRVFARTYRTGVDWETSFSLPSFSQGKLNIAPQVSIQKQDGRSPLIVRTERTGGRFVTQGLRPSVGVSMSPKLYGFFPGFGQVERIRHAIEPTLQWSWAPRANVSDEFLAANGDVAVGFLGNLPQNQLSLGLTTSFEAKMRPRERAFLAPVEEDSSADSTETEAGAASRRRAQQQEEQGRKVKLLSMTFTTLSYDFVRARESSGGTGLTNRTFDWSARSELLPGFDLGMNYSLFQGDPVSDTAVFSPYREGVRASMALDANSPIIRGLARIVGIKMADSATRARQEAGRQGGARQGAEGAERQRGGGDNSNFIAGQPIGGNRFSSSMQIPSGQGWRVNLSYTGNRMRPPVGSNVRDYDPKEQCALLTDFVLQTQCLNQFATGTPTSTGLPFNETTRGATLYRMPPQGNINGSMSFHVTNLWSAQWQTSYDVVRSEFAQHSVTMQRAMHDWDAIFSFLRAPNGNFSFMFNVALRAQPDIKLDFDRRDSPRGLGGRQPF